MMEPNIQLKQEREQRGWSQVRLAHELGIDAQTISRWERGAARPYPHYRALLCHIFEKNARELGLETAREDLDAVSTSLPSPSLLDPLLPLPVQNKSGLIGRHELFATIQALLLSSRPAPMALLRGLPGVGKTALATALARDPNVQAYFHDGILWAGVGPEPDLSSLLSRWGSVLDCTPSREQADNNTLTWARALRTAIGQRRMLLVLDDVWDIESLQALQVGGSQCAYLITTRFPQITMHFALQDAFAVSELDEHNSLALLHDFVPGLVDDDPATMRTLVQIVGGLPLALTLTGNYLRAHASTGQPRRLQMALAHLRDAAYRLHLSTPHPLAEEHPSLHEGSRISLASMIAASIEHIDDCTRQALYTLALFPSKPGSFSEEVALLVTQAPVDVLDTLSDAGLLESPEPGRYQIHQTIADYARLQHNNPDKDSLSRRKQG